MLACRRRLPSIGTAAWAVEATDSKLCGLDQRYRVVMVVSDNNKSGRERGRPQQSSVDMRQRHTPHRQSCKYSNRYHVWRLSISKRQWARPRCLCIPLWRIWVTLVVSKGMKNARCVRIYNISLLRGSRMCEECASVCTEFPRVATSQRRSSAMT